MAGSAIVVRNTVGTVFRTRVAIGFVGFEIAHLAGTH